MWWIAASIGGVWRAAASGLTYASDPLLTEFHCLPAWGACLIFTPADVVDLKREHQRALLARTLYGHVQNLLGYVLSLYCVYRCVQGERV